MRAAGGVYPAGMTPEPVPPPSRGSEPGSATDPEQSQPAEPPPGERYGPVAIARHVKDDGRALLLYSLNPEESG